MLQTFTVCFLCQDLGDHDSLEHLFITYVKIYHSPFLFVFLCFFCPLLHPNLLNSLFPVSIACFGSVQFSVYYPRSVYSICITNFSANIYLHIILKHMLAWCILTEFNFIFDSSIVKAEDFPHSRIYTRKLYVQLYDKNMT